MFRPKTFYTAARAIKILLLLLLIGFEYVFSLSGSDAQYANEAGFQRTRSQILITAVYTLRSRPATERTQALHDLQTILPTFQQEQTFLQSNASASALDFLQQAQSNYLPMTATIQNIIAHPNEVLTPLEMSVLTFHQQNYVVTMNFLILTLPEPFESHVLQLFVIQIIIEILFLIMFFIAMSSFLWEIGTYKEQRTRPLPAPFFVRRTIVFVLIIGLMGIEIVPLGTGGHAAYLSQATLQQLRCEAFATSALVLTSGSEAEKVQALVNVQSDLALFQQEQNILLTNGSADVHHSVIQALSEYQTMTVAIQALAAQPDPAVVTTIVSHAPECVAVMNGIVAALQQQMKQQTTWIFFTEITIEGVLLLFFAVLLMFSYDPFVPRENARQSARSYPS